MTPLDGVVTGDELALHHAAGGGQACQGVGDRGRRQTELFRGLGPS